MEYLRDLFHEELDADGEVEIANQTFERHRILREMAEDAYDIVFRDWKRMRREALLDKANEILKLYENGDRFEQLSKGVNTRNVWPFVGAGLSASAGFPLWTDFLYHLCEQSHVSPENLSILLSQGEYEKAAQILHDDLGSALFNERVQAKYNRTLDAVGPVNYLPLVFPEASVITTNFDHVLETVFSGNDSQGFDRTVSGKQTDEALRIISSGSKVLIKIHGSCENVTGRVLLASEYDDAYGENGSAADFFRRILFGKSLLFLGCSLVFDRTLKRMIEVTEHEGAHKLPRHYAFIELSKPAERIEKQKVLAHANIFPIWYPTGDHDESIEALLIALLE